MVAVSSLLPLLVFEPLMIVAPSPLWQAEGRGGGGGGGEIIYIQQHIFLDIHYRVQQWVRTVSEDE